MPHSPRHDLCPHRKRRRFSSVKAAAAGPQSLLVRGKQLRALWTSGDRSSSRRSAWRRQNGKPGMTVSRRSMTRDPLSMLIDPSMTLFLISCRCAIHADPEARGQASLPAKRRPSRFRSKSDLPFRTSAAPPQHSSDGFSNAAKTTRPRVVERCHLECLAGNT